MKLQTKTTTEFFSNEYVNFASYDNLRKIASVIDGQKNAARKVLWYTQQKNLKQEIKVSQLDSKVAEETEYLHGSMAGVIVNLAQDYPGTNNINLLMPEGNFGSGLIPDASAARYIYTYGSENFFDIFNKEDTDILEHQTFEGKRIEPIFMLPVIPILLVNGAEGISSGFAQKILPRNPKEITKYINYRLSHLKSPKRPFKGKPWYRGFKGKIEQGDSSKSWNIYGVFERKANKVSITELPIGYSLKKYIKILDKLEDQKKIISYQDNSTSSFEFIVQFNRKFLDSLSDSEIIDLLKLKKRITENYTVMTEHNTVQIYDSVDDIMQHYIEVKLNYLQKRKDHKIMMLSSDIKMMVSKYVFLKNVIDNTLKIHQRETSDIVRDLSNIKNIITINDSYDYLLSMPIRSMTRDNMQKLMIKIKEQKNDLDKLKVTSINDIWISEL